MKNIFKVSLFVIMFIISYGLIYSDSTGVPPFNINDSFLFGGVPEAIFSTGILSHPWIGPTGLRNNTLPYDGNDFNSLPLTMRRFRDRIYQLERCKLDTTILPEYMKYIDGCQMYCWDRVHTNTLLFFIADIAFEWDSGF